jgi:hypothetical protein
MNALTLGDNRGACLNPRFGSVDLKMWAEVRVPWVLLFMIAVSGGCKQYETYGYVTPVSAFCDQGVLDIYTPFYRTWPS